MTYKQDYKNNGIHTIHNAVERWWNKIHILFAHSFSGWHLNMDTMQNFFVAKLARQEAAEK